MSFNLPVQIILILSSLMVLGLVFKKLPVLVRLGAVGEGKKFNWKPILLKLKEKIKAVPFLKDFSFEMFLQKVLSKIRVLIMKTENKTFTWLSQLRERAQKKYEKKDDNYWEELKKIKDKK